MEHTTGLGLGINLGSYSFRPQSHISKPPVDRLGLLNPRSATFIDDVIEFQLLCGPHHFVPGTIPVGIDLALMAWGIIRSFEVCDDPYDDEYDSDEEMKDYDEGYYPSDNGYYDDDWRTPESTAPSSPQCMNLNSKPTSYAAAVVHFTLPQLPLAQHQWPPVFGKHGEPPVHSNWLLSFEHTESLLQQRAYLVAATNKM